MCLFIQQQIFIECLGPGSILGPADKEVHKTDESPHFVGLTFQQRDLESCGSLM